MGAYTKPLPAIDELSRPFWEAARRHELRLPKCTSCGVYRTHFEKWCQACGSDQFVMEKLSGTGTVWSHGEFHKVYFHGFATPYNVALIKLNEGPLFPTNIVECDSKDIHIDMEVEVVFEDVTPEVTLVKFRPAKRT